MNSETKFKKVKLKDEDGYELKNVFYFKRNEVDGFIELRNEYCSLRHKVTLSEHILDRNKPDIWTLFDKNGNYVETILGSTYAKKRMFELSKSENPKLRMGRLSYVRNNIYAYL